MHLTGVLTRSVAISGFGVAVEVEAGHVSLEELASTLRLPRSAADVVVAPVRASTRLTSVGGFFAVERDGERVVNGAGDGVSELIAEIEHAIAELSPTHVFVHAGVVGTPDGAIVIPATSGAGKTTLVAAFLEAGATYYSDEYAVLDAGGLVHPYPRRLGIRDDDGKQHSTDAAEFGAPTATTPTRVVAVLALRRGSRTRLRALTPGQTVVKLLEHTVIAQIDPPRALNALSAAAGQAIGFTGTRGEAAVFARNFLRRAPWRRE